MATESPAAVSRKMTLHEAIEYVDRTKGYRPKYVTLRKWIVNGCQGHYMRATRLGGTWLVDPADIDLFLRVVEELALRR